MPEKESINVTDGESYRAWRDRMGYSHAESAKALGFCRRTSINYQNGSTKKLPGAVVRLCGMLERDRMLGL